MNNTQPLIKSTFSVDGEKTFTGYHDPDKTWNGWAVPFFTWENACDIAQWYNEWSGDEPYILKIDQKNKIIYDHTIEDEDYEITGVPTLTVDGVIPLYAVCSGYWIWGVWEV